MAQVLFQCLEELLQFSLVKLDTSLTERVNQVADASTHDFTTLTSIEFLSFDLADKRLDLAKDLRVKWQALGEVVLA